MRFKDKSETALKVSSINEVNWQESAKDNKLGKAVQSRTKANEYIYIQQMLRKQDKDLSA